MPQSPTEEGHDYIFENIDSPAFTERGEALVHVTSFVLMLQSLENGVDSSFFQLYSISRFHVVDDAFVFEALNQDSGYLNVHILVGSHITAKSVETGLSVAIQLKMEEMGGGKGPRVEPNPYAHQASGYGQPIPSQGYDYGGAKRKTSFFSDVGSPPSRQGSMIDMVTQSLAAFGDFFKPARRRSSGAGRARQISI